MTQNRIFNVLVFFFHKSVFFFIFAHSLTRNLAKTVKLFVKLSIFAQNRIFNFLVLFYHKSVFFFIFAHSLTRNLAENVYFYPKSLFQFLSLLLSLFCTSPFSTNPRATINFERVFSAKRWFLRIWSQKCLFLCLHDATRFCPKTTSYLKIVNMIKCLNLMNCPKTISFSCHEASCSFPETKNDSKW